VRQIDFLIPVYNEGDSLTAFHQSLQEVTKTLPAEYSCRFIYVNDGSNDETQTILERIADADSRVGFIELSRNFGHQAALSAALDATTGEIVITMDGDGQHPPSVVPELLRLHANGYDIVQAQRIDANETGLFKRWTSRSFYRILSTVGEVTLLEGVSDFRLLSRDALNALKQLPEYHRFLRGMIVWIGFPTVMLPYKPNVRLAGNTKYSLRKMLRLAADGMFSFSLVPLRVGLVLGTIFIALAALEVIFVGWVWITSGRSQLVPGWTSIILILTLSSAINMILVGILGIYVGMIFQEVKRRPVYLVRSRSK
jgi:dolichol-phosphate mannosyltransferase